MNISNTSNGKVNAIALEVMQAVNSAQEDHSKTMELLKNLQLAIQETRLKAS
jgi:hypothetical protein